MTQTHTLSHTQTDTRTHIQILTQTHTHTNICIQAQASMYVHACIYLRGHWIKLENWPNILLLCISGKEPIYE